MKSDFLCFIRKFREKLAYWENAVSKRFAIALKITSQPASGLLKPGEEELLVKLVTTLSEAMVGEKSFEDKSEINFSCEEVGFSWTGESVRDWFTTPIARQ